MIVCQYIASLIAQMNRRTSNLNTCTMVNTNHINSVVDKICKEIDLMVAEGAFGNINVTLPNKFHGLDKGDLAAELKKQYIGKQSYGVNDHTDLKILKRVMTMDILVFREHKDKYWYGFKQHPVILLLKILKRTKIKII